MGSLKLGDRVRYVGTDERLRNKTGKICEDGPSIVMVQFDQLIQGSRSPWGCPLTDLRREGMFRIGDRVRYVGGFNNLLGRVGTVVFFDSGLIRVVYDPPVNRSPAQDGSWASVSEELEPESAAPAPAPAPAPELDQKSFLVGSCSPADAADLERQLTSLRAERDSLLSRNGELFLENRKLRATQPVSGDQSAVISELQREVEWYRRELARHDPDLVARRDRNWRQR